MVIRWFFLVSSLSCRRCGCTARGARELGAAEQPVRAVFGTTTSCGEPGAACRGWGRTTADVETHTWHLTLDTWHLTLDTWHLTLDRNKEINKLQHRKQSPHPKLSCGVMVIRWFMYFLFAPGKLRYQNEKGIFPEVLKTLLKFLLKLITRITAPYHLVELHVPVVTIAMWPSYPPELRVVRPTIIF
jgi:hypothetical protein